MTTENALPWAEEADCAVTVCDTEGVILYMNEKARATFAQHGDLIGRNLFDCHNFFRRFFCHLCTYHNICHNWFRLMKMVI